jgi:hypothetical protein
MTLPHTDKHKVTILVGFIALQIVHSIIAIYDGRYGIVCFYIFSVGICMFFLRRLIKVLWRFEKGGEIFIIKRNDRIKFQGTSELSYDKMLRRL